jgi:hypothetical protein
MSISLANASNELILQSLQDMDISQIAEVLKILGEAAAAANVDLNAPAPVFHPPPLDQMPPTSGNISKPSQNQVLSTSNHPDGSPVEDHAYILANKWLNSSKLNELSRTQGMSSSGITRHRQFTLDRPGVQKGQVFCHRRTAS